MFHDAYMVFQRGGSVSCLFVGRHKFKSLQDESFNNMKLCLSAMVLSIRNWYRNRMGQHHKFISVSQDIWDSKRWELLGVSLMFIHPETFQLFKLSARLVHITGKKATQIDHNTLTVLKRYGITQEDLF